MDVLIGFDWREVFLPDRPVLEIVVRGSIVYLFIFFLLRIVLKRESGSLGITDLLVVVLIADAAQNAMAGEYRSIPDGLVLVSTIVFWSYALNWLGFHVPRVARLVRPAPLLLARDGRLLRRNLEKELITEEELLGQLRLQGVDSLEKTREVWMEEDGRISVIMREEAAAGKHREKGGRRVL